MLILNRSEVESLLDLDALIDALEETFVELSAGRASVPPRVAASTPAGFLAAMPAFVSETLSTKLVSVFHDNPARGLPGHQALIALFDEHSGTPIAVMDGTAITASRTACASGVATRALAREDASVLAVIGAGVQGRSHLEAIPRVRRCDEIRVTSRVPAHAEALARDFDAIAVDDFEEAVTGADVVCLCTASASPVIERSWLAPGTHVNSVGFSTEGGELDAATLSAGLLVVESRVAFEPPPAGAAELQGLDPEDAVELGEILSGKHPGRSSPEEITVYKSMGHAAEDAVAARLIYDAALEQKVGTEVAL